MRDLTFKINVPVSVFKEGEYYVAYSPVLDLSTSGGSIRQVKNRFGEAVEIFIEECAEAGTLDEALANLGWQKVRSQWHPPKLVSQEQKEFIVGAHV